MGQSTTPKASNEALHIGGRYKHYKGNLYRVHGVVRHSETLEELVHYETLYENKLGKMWVRPKAMFLEDIEIAGRRMPRFEYIGE
jgi:hypothetical protein